MADSAHPSRHALRHEANEGNVSRSQRHGSGTPVLLEFARVLRGTDPKFSLRRVPIRFLFLDGEEALPPFWGGADYCYGSREPVRRISIRNELDSIGACVLLDMVGDSDTHFLEETGRIVLAGLPGLVRFTIARSDRARD